MHLNITLNDKHYKSDNLENGRIAKKFFKKLTNYVYYQSFSYYRKKQELTGETEFPLIFGERNLYSTFATAINKMTSVHLSEWSFNRAESNIDKSRRVDFWCQYKEGYNGRTISYWIEVKKGWYCLNRNSKPEFNKRIRQDIKDLQTQISSIKKINPKWDEKDDTYIGMIVIHTYCIDGLEKYSIEDIEEQIAREVDKRKVKNYLISSWILPEELMKISDNEDQKFVTIIGFIVTKLIS